MNKYILGNPQKICIIGYISENEFPSIDALALLSPHNEKGGQ
jgi:hypothetical protein